MLRVLGTAAIMATFTKSSAVEMVFIDGEPPVLAQVISTSCFETLASLGLHMDYKPSKCC